MRTKKQSTESIGSHCSTHKASKGHKSTSIIHQSIRTSVNLASSSIEIGEGETIKSGSFKKIDLNPNHVHHHFRNINQPIDARFLSPSQQSQYYQKQLLSQGSSNKVVSIIGLNSTTLSNSNKAAFQTQPGWRIDQSKQNANIDFGRSQSLAAQSVVNITDNDYNYVATELGQVKTSSMKSLNVTAGFQQSETFKSIQKDIEEENSKIKRNCEETETQMLE